MLSASHHIAYWAISATAAATYQFLVSRTEIPESVFRHSFKLLAGYMFYILWRGPRQRSCPPWIHHLLTGCTILSLGAATDFVQLVPDVDASRIQFPVHILLAFTALGTLESVRQNVGFQRRFQVERRLIKKSSSCHR